MNQQETLKIAMQYRNNLIQSGQRVATENPDRLTKDEMEALLEKIFAQINKIDMSMGYEYHDVGLRLPPAITKERQEELFLEFIDWYQVVDTPSEAVRKYVTRNYSSQKYPQILCIGDGENCHLGRKLAMQGYRVVSVDPLAKKEFSMRKSSKGGSLHVVQGEFNEKSEDMIRWAHAIVGSKVPLCAESLVSQKKPAIFSISNNVEIYNMRFKGKTIHSSKELSDAIRKCKGVETEIVKGIYQKMKDVHYLFVMEEK